MFRMREQDSRHLKINVFKIAIRKLLHSILKGTSCLSLIEEPSFWDFGSLSAFSVQNPTSIFLKLFQLLFSISINISFSTLFASHSRSSLMNLLIRSIGMLLRLVAKDNNWFISLIIGQKRLQLTSNSFVVTQFGKNEFVIHYFFDHLKRLVSRIGNSFSFTALTYTSILFQMLRAFPETTFSSHLWLTNLSGRCELPVTSAKSSLLLEESLK